MNNFNHCGGGFPAFGNHHDKPFDGEQKGLGKIFYKSDFSVWLADPTGDKTTPFTLTFYVGDLESTYTAGFDGLDYKRCKRNEDGSLLVFFDRHALPCGRLMLRVEIDKANPYYADGEQNTADKLPLPIILWDGATSYEPTMAYALAPYIVGKDGEKGEDGKPFTYDDLTEEEKKDLGEKATAELAATVQRTYTAADKDAMAAIENPKEGDICTFPAIVQTDLSTVKVGETILKVVGFGSVEEIGDFAAKLKAALPSGEVAFGYWNNEDDSPVINYEIMTAGLTLGVKTLIGMELALESTRTAAINDFNALPEERKKVVRVGGIWNYAATYNGESPVTVEVLRENTYTYHDGAWTLQEEKAGKATTPALLTAADADAMNALTTAKDGDRCIVGGNAIYDRVGGKWYFTAGVQPAKTVKASELKAGDKIKAVNFDTSKTPEGTGDGIFCTIGGVPIEMMAFIDSLSYGTGKTPLFTGTWNTANTAACSAAMAGKTVDSVAASMAALSANVDDWLSFEIE